MRHLGSPLTRIISFLILFCGMASCNNSTNPPGETMAPLNSSDTGADSTMPAAPYNFTVLVLPPYDKIAGRGISPNIQKLLEEAMAGDSSLSVLKFPYSKLVDVPYQNVFSKLYYMPIWDRVRADIIIMSKIDLQSETGNMFTNKWDLLIKYYYAPGDKEILSKLTANDLTIPQIGELISSQRQKLYEEIDNLP
jgi:hypothetical protein